MSLPNGFTYNAGMNYSWENCPLEFKNLVDDIVTNHRDILCDNLTGIYLHGSLAMGCFNPVVSDLDYLAVVKQEVPVAEKKAVVEYLLSLHDRTPAGDIEMSIVLERYLHNFVYPTPFELHCSSSWSERFINGEVDFTVTKTDEDLAAHSMVILERGVRLFGKPIAEVFTDTAHIKEAFRKSLLFDAGYLFEAYERNPLYTTLNLCRNLAYMREGKVLSKAEGADWALDNLPADFSPLITSAKNRYLGTGEGEMDAELLEPFVGFVKKEFDDMLGRS